MTHALAPPVRIERLVDEAAACRPEHRALVFAGLAWSYAQLRSETERRAGMLVQAGLVPGDIVATIERVTHEMAITFLACCRADLTFFPIPAHLTTADVVPLLARARPRALLTAEGQPHSAIPSVPALPLRLPGQATSAARLEWQRRSSEAEVDAVAIIQMTSGTTGAAPKLVRTPHRTLTWLRTAPIWWQVPSAVHYFPYPTLFAVRGVCDALWHGATMVLSQATNPRRIEREMVEYGVTALGTVPAMVRLLVEQHAPPPAGLALDIVRTVAAALPTDVQHALKCRYGATIIQEYASTEGGAMIATPREGAPLGSIGVPYPGVEARFVSADGKALPDDRIGELLVHSPGIMLGYHDDVVATDRALSAGWLRTGDLARRNADGFVFLEGREGLRINVGGYKVAPEEVEAILESHPAVQEAAVTAMADARHGEVVRALIVTAGVRPPVRELRRFCRERLASYKVPRRIEFRDALPRSALGKLLRHQL